MHSTEIGQGDIFLVCGLGSLGQYCVVALKEFGVAVHAIEVAQPQNWEIPTLPAMLNQLVLGDCRQPQVLEQAGIRHCRAVLLVTADEGINTAAAFAARALNPNARLVMRSAQENLNELLHQQLGNFVAYEATQLPAPSFALAALNSETQGFFTLGNQLLQVSTIQITANHPWCNHPLYELNQGRYRLLYHTRRTHQISDSFSVWEPDDDLRVGDDITLIEMTGLTIPASRSSHRSKQVWQSLRRRLTWHHLQQTVRLCWRNSRGTQRVVAISSLLTIGLFLSGALLYKFQYPTLSFSDTLNIALVLIIGGFDNLFGQLKLEFSLPWWLYLFSLSMTVAGTIFVGILYATLTEWVLATRFQFLRPRSPMPTTNHIVLIGLGRVGQQVATLLQELSQSLIGISANDLPAETLPEFPVITGKTTDALVKAHVATAKSVVVVTDSEVANLEIGLMARAMNPACNLVLRTTDPIFAGNVARLLPDAKVFGVYALAAEAFVGAAFGENILYVFRINTCTTLVTEYQIEYGDTLNGLLLAEVSYGYGVVPILHHKQGYEMVHVLPSEDARLQVGDRLIVLATIAGLQRIEQGAMQAKQWRVQIDQILSTQTISTATRAIAHMAGCDIMTASSFLKHPPCTISALLHKQQALRLIRDLEIYQVIAHLAPAEKPELPH
ncbi:NAD-binding protein [Pantanalinema sp. GBBB05]|uniref:NAD-binding protein n=1 Tax=Pantanalinema sp. GBBB05 TaxID=2604139 RepID=UPI001E08EAAC|nr:potassium transporter TrkA [Pantanalinema sp. GBBB05]